MSESQVYCQSRQGISVGLLAKQHGLSPLAVEQMINKVRTKCILAQAVEIIYSASFEGREAAATILGPMPDGRPSLSRSRPPAGLPPYIANLYADAQSLIASRRRTCFAR